MSQIMNNEITKEKNNKINTEKNNKINTKKNNKKIKCFQCKKKLMLMQQIKCQCNHYFCPCHMNRHSHNCPLNITDITKKIIEKNNPLVGIKMKDKI